MMNGAIDAGKLDASLAPLRARWRSLGPRERRAVKAAAAVLGLALAWLLLIAPAWRSVQAAPARLNQLDAQLQQMQRLAAEVRGLRGTAPIGNAQSLAALKAASDPLGGAGRLVIAGERATLNFNNASGVQLRDWLAEVRTAARARVVEAKLSRGAQGYSGSVVLALPGPRP